MKHRIYLLGLMGCGKTTVGKILSKKLVLPFYDLDEIIEMQVGMSISAYFEKSGEENFRTVEKECLHSTFSLNGAIIATGGGTPCFFDNMEEINKNGTSVYLEANAKLLFSRLKDGREQRPLISKLSDEEVLIYLDELLEKRKPFYLKAHYTISAISPLEKMLEIFK